MEDSSDPHQRATLRPLIGSLAARPNRHAAEVRKSTSYERDEYRQTYVRPHVAREHL